MIANIISMVVHPFVISSLMIWLMMDRYMHENRVIATIGYGVCIILPLVSVVIYEVVVNGGDFDITNRRNRNKAYMISIAGIIVYVIVLELFIGISSMVVTIGTGMLVTLAIGVLINRYVTKISVHVTIAMYCSICVFMFISGLVGGILLGMTLAVSWSRIQLGRHTVTQVILGGILPIITSLPLPYI